MDIKVQKAIEKAKVAIKPNPNADKEIKKDFGKDRPKLCLSVNLEFKDEVMNGVLIYTASGDSEGSLGGLVRQGKPGNLAQLRIQFAIS